MWLIFFYGFRSRAELIYFAKVNCGYWLYVEDVFLNRFDVQLSFTEKRDSFRLQGPVVRSPFSLNGG